MARPKRRIDKTTCKQVAALRAEGLSQKNIGRALGMSSDTVRGVLRLPQTQTDYVRAREIIGLRVLGHVGELLDPAWQMAEDCIARGDAKGLAEAMQNLLRLERIADSVVVRDRMMRPAPPPAGAAMKLDALRSMLEQVRPTDRHPTPLHWQAATNHTS